VSIHKWGILSHLLRRTCYSDFQPHDKRTLLLPLWMMTRLFYLILTSLSLLLMHTILNVAFYQSVVGFSPLTRVKRFAETMEAHT
jgi:hypothetical protein